jgi:hypothetical protein
MKKIIFVSILLAVVLAMSLAFLSCGNDTNDGIDASVFNQVMFVEDNPDKGFNYGYYYYIPQSIRKVPGKFLLVHPNNAGAVSNDYPDFTIDSMDIHAIAALRNLNAERGRADELGTVLLVPVIPRPRTFPPNIEPQILNHVALRTNNGKHARVDLQLISMIDDLREKLADIGIELEAKILLDGFSASANFSNKFTILHPELVQAVAAGGTLPLFPTAVMGGERLIFPVGIADLEEYTGRPFNLQQYLTVPQFNYFGDQDTIIPLRDNQVFYGDAAILNERLFHNDPLEFWEAVQNVHNELGSNAIFRTMYGVGHTDTPEIRREVTKFLGKAIGVSVP